MVRIVVAIACLTSCFLAACDLVPSGSTAGQPIVAIVAPPSGTTVSVGEKVTIQSAAADTSGIVRVELIVDGAIVSTNAPPSGQPQPQFTLLQEWIANSPGSHLVTVRASSPNGATGQNSINLNVVAQAAQAVTATPTAAEAPQATLPPPSATPTAASVPPSPAPNNVPTQTPTAAATPTETQTLVPSAVPTTAVPPCTSNSKFVADVTIPDGTSTPAGNAFVKTWRLLNSGTCDWGGAYTMVFIGGEQMGAPSPIVIPFTAPGGTADLTVNMIAPSASGAHKGSWRLRDGSGVFFGTSFSVLIDVPGAPTPVGPTGVPESGPTSVPGAEPTTAPIPEGCSGVPTIASFTASPSTINAGQNSKLSWGLVSNANAVSIDHGVGGVATPGEKNVNPSQTTTYVMTATGCGGSTTTKSVTVTVNGLPPAAVKVTVEQVSATANVGANSETVRGVFCPDGTQLAGGGFLLGTYTARVVTNGADNSSPNRWVVRVSNGAQAGSVTAYAFCLKNAPGSVTIVKNAGVVNGNSVTPLTATCPGGSKIVGGGFFGDVFLVPEASQGDPTHWVARASNPIGGPGTWIAIAVCYDGSATTNLRTASGNAAANGNGEANADCLGDEIATGGGWTINPTYKPYIFQSTRSGDKRWQVFAHNAAGVAVPFSAQAICVDFG